MNSNEIWSKRATVFDKLEWVHTVAFLDLLIDSCGAREDFIALDIGSGTGIISTKLAPLVNRVTGIDISREMIDEAVRKSQDNPHANLSYIQMDAQQMNFPDDTFDLITARMVFHHIDDVEKAMKASYRVLKKGGRLVLCEGVPPDHRTRKRYEEIFTLKEKRHTFSEAELINLFHHTGFSHITLRPFFMSQVSLVNWLKNSSVEDEVAQQILELHLTADEHFKRVYRMSVNDNDIYIDWKFVIVVGEK